MDPNIDPKLAADLSKASSKQLAADLSKQGMEARRRKAKVARMARWARVMNRTFKGISGSHNRRGYIEAGMERHNLSMDDVEQVLGVSE